MSLFVQQNCSISNFNTSDSWVILSQIEQSIRRKIEAVGKPLKDWDIQIYRGVLTGYNEAFIISTEKRDEILSNCIDEDERERTAAIIRPILRGRDIKRYGYNWADLWLINTHNGVKGAIPRIDVNDYPAIKQHLDYYWDSIAVRADKGDTPYNLRNCAYLEDFNKPMIVWLELSDEPKFTLAKNVVPLNTVFFFTGDQIVHLLGLLNSKLITWYFKNCIGTTSGVGTNRWLKYTIEQIPMIPYNEKIELLTNKLVSPSREDSTTHILESELLSEICDSYGLSETEKKYIILGGF